jgi:hypothetical protein
MRPCSYTRPNLFQISAISLSLGFEVLNTSQRVGYGTKTRVLGIRELLVHTRRASLAGDFLEYTMFQAGARMPQVSTVQVVSFDLL